MGKYDAVLQAIERRNAKARVTGARVADPAPELTYAEAVESVYGDESGRLPEARAKRHLETARDAQIDGWTFDLVKARLREMARGMERLIRKPGPNDAKGFWPEPTLYAHVTDQDRWHWYEGIRDGTREPEKPKFAIDGRAVTRMEQALHWPWRYLADDAFVDEREALMLWVACQAMRGRNFGEETVALGCSRSTAYARRDRGISIILECVIRDGVQP